MSKKKLKLKSKTGRTFVADSIGKCAFCNRGLSSVSDDVTNTFGLVHELPTCRTFETLDVPEFVRASRAKLGMSPGSSEEN